MSLTTNDLQSIKGIVQESIQESETRLENKFTDQIQASAIRLESKFTDKIKESEIRLENKFTDQIQKSEIRIESKLTKKIASSERRLTKKIKISETSLEKRLKAFVINELSTQLSSNFRIQNMVLDTEFRKIDSKFDNLDKRMSKEFVQKSKHLHKHDTQIATLTDRVDDIDEQMPLHV